jgi:hypothetical protein
MLLGVMASAPHEVRLLDSATALVDLLVMIY